MGNWTAFKDLSINTLTNVKFFVICNMLHIKEIMTIVKQSFRKSVTFSSGGRPPISRSIWLMPGVIESWKNNEEVCETQIEELFELCDLPCETSWATGKVLDTKKANHDWQVLNKRLKWYSGRLNRGWYDGALDVINSGWPMTLFISGFFGMQRQLLGDEALKRKLPLLVRTGGYLCTVDHRIHIGSSYKYVLYFMKRVKAYFN